MGVGTGMEETELQGGIARGRAGSGGPVPLRQAGPGPQLLARGGGGRATGPQPWGQPGLLLPCRQPAPLVQPSIIWGRPGPAPLLPAPSLSSLASPDQDQMCR